MNNDDPQIGALAGQPGLPPFPTWPPPSGGAPVLTPELGPILNPFPYGTAQPANISTANPYPPGGIWKGTFYPMKMPIGVTGQNQAQNSLPAWPHSRMNVLPDKANPALSAISPAPLSGAGTPKSAILGGYNNLVFSEYFTGPLDVGFGTPGHKWNAGLWYETVPPASSFVVNNAVLTITAIPPATGVNLCTQYHDFSGGTSFQGGYFEALMQCTDWSAFWLYDWKHPFNVPVVPSNPLTYAPEIDIIETDPGPLYRHSYLGNIHLNSSGSGGVADTVAPGANVFTLPNNGSPFNEWHIYGLLWTQAAVTWFVDNIQVASTPAYASTWQPCQLILGAGAGGTLGGASDVNPPITKVQWVRAWGP